jgi:hypothetical protein
MKKFLSLSQVGAIVGSIVVVVLVSSYFKPLKAAVGTK